MKTLKYNGFLIPTNFHEKLKDIWPKGPLCHQLYCPGGNPVADNNCWKCLAHRRNKKDFEEYLTTKECLARIL